MIVIHKITTDSIIEGLRTRILAFEKQYNITSSAMLIQYYTDDNCDSMEIVEWMQIYLVLQAIQR